MKKNHTLSLNTLYIRLILSATHASELISHTNNPKINLQNLKNLLDLKKAPCKQTVETSYYMIQ